MSRDVRHFSILGPRHRAELSFQTPALTRTGFEPPEFGANSSWPSLRDASHSPESHRGEPGVALLFILSAYLPTRGSRAFQGSACKPECDRPGVGRRWQGLSSGVSWPSAVAPERSPSVTSFSPGPLASGLSLLSRGRISPRSLQDQIK